MIVITIVFFDLYLLSNGDPPVPEKAAAIGQWAPWVGICLAIIAAALDKNHEEAVKHKAKDTEDAKGPMVLRLTSGTRD
jgi:hypothetical protein